MTECNQKEFAFAPHFSRQVSARFSERQLSTEGGALLLRETDRKIGEAAGHACTAAFKVWWPRGQPWPTPQALDFQERLLRKMLLAAEQVDYPAAS